MKPPCAPSRPFASLATSIAAVLALAFAVASPAHANAEQSSADASEASMFPIALSVALPVLWVAGVGELVVTGVQASGQGVVWVVENTVDGAKASIRFTGHAVGQSAIAVGTVVRVTAIGAGTLLSVAGEVVAFVPNEIGKALLYNEKVSR